jgi:hypothetical protein
MVNAGVLSLPDASEIDCEVVMLDGGSYVVETNVKHAYRTYRYPLSNPPKCKEVTSMMAIGDIIFEEFGSQIFPDGPVR